MNIGVLDGLFDFGGKLIDRLIPDPAQKLAAQQELMKLAINKELAVMANETALIKLQTDINLEQAKSPNAFISGPRPFLMWVGGIGTGLSVALAWWFSYSVSKASFEVVHIQGITFSGPSAEWLMRVLAPNPPGIGFDFGLMPGVFLGSFLAAWMGKELKLEGFKDGYAMRRYIVGAVFMGFGAMLAGGCAVGAGVTGGSIFALTAWVSLIGMWMGAGLVDRWIDTPPASAPNLIQP